MVMSSQRPSRAAHFSRTLITLKFDGTEITVSLSDLPSFIGALLVEKSCCSVYTQCGAVDELRRTVESSDVASSRA